MNYLKVDIICWLEQYKINNYELIDSREYGYVVNVPESVRIIDQFIGSIGVKFNIIQGHFDCSNTGLTTLYGCPDIVIGDFICVQNKLTDLQFGPSIVEGGYFCYKNQLTTLKGVAQKVESLSCMFNELTSIEHCPRHITHSFFCFYNKISKLVEIPHTMNRIEIFRNPINLPKRMNLQQLKTVFEKEVIDNNLTINNVKHKPIYKI